MAKLREKLIRWSGQKRNAWYTNGRKTNTKGMKALKVRVEII